MRQFLPPLKFWAILFITNLFHTATAQNLLDPKTQPKFVNPLPVPSVIDGRNGGLFTISVSQFDQWLGLVNPQTNQQINTTVWGYNGSYPGPTILAKKNTPVRVFWRNNLLNGMNQPLPHLLPIDPTIHWALSHQQNWQQFGIPIVSHLHGGRTESASDGLPDAWFTPNFTRKGSGFIKGDIEPYYYGNEQEAATTWYHDHALGITRLNVYAGLAGYYLITDANEMNLQNTGKLPIGPYDLGLAIQDRMFTTDGHLFYPSANGMGEMRMSMGEPGESPDPSILPEFFGNFILVNGMTWPVLDVEPRQYRFRVLNGADSRFFNLFLSNGQQITQIGTDGGFLNAPVSMNQMLIAPGERKDIILDFSHPSLWGQTIIMRNNAKSPFPKGAATDPQTTGQVMAFRITKPLNANYPLTNLPATLRTPIVPLQTNLAPRKLILFEAEDEYGRLKPMLGTVNDGVLEWHDPITENPMLNSTEIWEIYNETADAHPIHLHLVNMQLINRQKFIASIDEENGKPSNIRLIGQPKYPGPDEVAWKDTWVMYPGEVTRVIAKFDVEGLYVWHCHILSHEDHEMMRPFYVGEIPGDPVHKSAAITVAESKIKLTLSPNPFSTTVKLQVTIPAKEKLMINLYDSKGGLVKTIYNAEKDKGLHEFNIDGSDMVSGVYFCEVNNGRERIVRKLVLQK
jgi:spore coat protein A